MKRYNHKRIKLQRDTLRVLAGSTMQAVVGGLITTGYTSRDSLCVSLCADMSDC
jgi:hypothetical protein